MEKYNSKNASYPETDDVWYPNPDSPELVGRIDYPHIIFRKEDRTFGMKVSLEEIVDVWLETLKPEQQSKLELEQTVRSEKRELATLRKEKEIREEDAKRSRVRNMLKPFLEQQMLKVLKERGLEITKSNIRSLIGECKEISPYRNSDYYYNPMGILFTEKEWGEFRENCNKIHMDGNPKKRSGRYDDYEETQKGCITYHLKELRNTPISYWK